VNAALYAIESLSTLLFAIVSIALIARHFGPENLARYSVAQSISAMFMVFATLGLEQFLIRELARDEHDATLVTSLLTAMLLGWLIYVGLIVSYYLATGNLVRDLVLVFGVSLSALFTRTVFIKGYLQARNHPRPIAVASLVSRILAIVFLFAGTYAGFSYESMMFYLPIQAFVLFMVMAASQKEFFSLIKLQAFSLERLMTLLREASPIFVSTLLYFFFSQSDVLLMSHLLPATDVGVYSASIRLVPQAGFIGFILVSTFYREMDNKLKEDRAAFESYVKSVLAIKFALGIGMAAVITLSAEQVIHLLYGDRYADSARVLAIACWAWVFMFPAALYSRLLIMLGYARYELFKMLIIAPLVLLLNFLAISYIGILGGAIMFVVTYVLVDFLVYFIFKDTRQFGILGLKALCDILFRPRQTFFSSVNLLKAKA
jgi:O-antigen/teichoic acid export membrane protein